MALRRSARGAAEMIDWYAYTIEIPRMSENQITARWLYDAFHAIPDYMRPRDGIMDWSAKRSGWTAGMNIGNHTFVWIRRDGLMLIEHTGRGCEHLRQENALMRVIDQTRTTCTRIDLAVDIHNPDMGVSPLEFAKNRGLKRVTAGGTQTSATGQTAYVGSRKSSRYCRVYQYTAPHPRSDYMRIEYVLKKDQAKAVCNLVLSHGVGAVERGMASFYEWRHDLYDWSSENATAVDVPAAHIDRSAEKTVRWLYGPVTQSVIKLVAESNLNLNDFVAHLRSSANADIPF
jgi:DNA relaxase NicK